MLHLQDNKDMKDDRAVSFVRHVVQAESHTTRQEVRPESQSEIVFVQFT